MKEVAERLKMKSADAAAKWCLSNNVEIFKSGKQNVVFEYEFRLAFEKPLIDKLKSHYGNNWQEYYKAYDSEQVLNFYTLETNAESVGAPAEAFDPNNFLKKIGYGKS